MTKYNQIILIILYLNLSILMTYSIYSNIKKDKMICIHTFFEIYFLIIYGITPIIYISSFNSSNSMESHMFLYTYNIKYYYWLFVTTFLFYILYRVFLKLKIKKKQSISSKKGNNIIDESSDKFLVSTILISIIGLISLFLWTKVYGKPWDIIKYANVIRSGRSTIYNPYTFFKPFCSFLIIAFYNNIIMFHKTRFKILNFINLCLNLFFSVVFLLGNDSRMMILIFFLCPFLYFKNKNVRINLKTFIVFFTAALLTLHVLSSLDRFTYFIRNGLPKEGNGKSGIAEIINNEFGYTYRNGVNVLYFYDKDNLPIIHEIKDIKNIALAFVPERFKKNDETLSDLNNSYYPNSTGSIPTDIITSSIYKFHLLGIILMPFIICIILKALEKLFSSFKSDYMFLIYNMIGCNTCLRFAGYYDLSDNLFSSFYIIACSIIILFMCMKKEKITLPEGGLK